MAIEDGKLSALLDDFGGICDTLRHLKFRVDSLVARAGLKEYADVTALARDADAITRIRPDAADLPVVTLQDYKELVSALGLLKTTLDAIPAATLEVFTPRAAS
jgi:hypothetical protein